MNYVTELIKNLTLELGMEYPAPVADTEATGIAVPDVSGNRPQDDAAFFASGAPSMGGAGQGPQGRRRLPGTATCSDAAHPVCSREAVHKPNRSKRTMTNTPTIFDFNSSAVRVVADDKGEPWFLANDVCTILGYANTSQAVKKNCREGGISKRYTPSESGDQEMLFINEGNLYRLIIKSRKPEAEAFEIKVMEEILPTIRKTGGYQIPGTKKALPGKLTAESQDLIKQAVRERVESLPKEKWGGASVTLWSAIGTKFGTRGVKDGYKNIPDEALSEIMSLIARTPLSGEYIEREEITEAMISAQIIKILTGTNFSLSFTAIENGQLIPQIFGHHKDARSFVPDGIIRDIRDRTFNFFPDALIPDLISAISHRLRVAA